MQSINELFHSYVLDLRMTRPCSVSSDRIPFTDVICSVLLIPFYLIELDFKRTSMKERTHEKYDTCEEESTRINLASNVKGTDNSPRARAMDIISTKLRIIQHSLQISSKNKHI
jgi:hypothetical protein